MPDLIITIHYPVSKPIDKIGKVTRVFRAEDTVSLYYPPTLPPIAREDKYKLHPIAWRHPKPSPGEKTITITIPTVSKIISEKPTTTYRVT